MPRPKNYGGNQGDEKKLRIPEGTQNARVVFVGYIGGITKKFNDSEKTIDTLIVTYELPDVKQTIKDNEEIPCVISKDYTFSYSENAHLRKHIEAIIGRSLKSEELDYDSDELYDVDSILNEACTVLIEHKKYTNRNGDEKTFTQVKSAGGLADSTKKHIPKATRKIRSFNIEKYTSLSELENDEDFKNLPTFIKNKIKQSTEYKALKEMANDSETNNSPEKVQEKPLDDTIQKDDIPPISDEGTSDLPF